MKRRTNEIAEKAEKGKINRGKNGPMRLFFLL